MMTLVYHGKIAVQFHSAYILVYEAFTACVVEVTATFLINRDNQIILLTVKVTIKNRLINKKEKTDEL